jgi:hypothetical protein
VLQSKSRAEIDNNHELSIALHALKFASKLSTDISCKMNAELAGEIDTVKYLSAPAAPTCYLVIVAYTGLQKVLPEDVAYSQTVMYEKFESLKFFSHRWGIAGEWYSACGHIHIMCTDIGSGSQNGYCDMLRIQWAFTRMTTSSPRLHRRIPTR